MTPLLTAVLIGCAQSTYHDNCTNLPDTPITDPEGLLDASALDELARAVVDFEHWTGTLDICVDEIRVVSQVVPDDPVVAGRWVHDQKLVEVEATNQSRLTEIVFHELCHALDDANALVEATEGVLDPDAVPEDHYPTEAARLAEAFADLCMKGPPPTALLDAYERSCGNFTGLLEDDTLVRRDVVWAGWRDAEDRVEAGPDIGFGEPILLEPYHSVAGDADQFYLLTWREETPELLDTTFTLDRVSRAGDRRRYWGGDHAALFPGLLGAPPVLLDTILPGLTWEVGPRGLEPVGEAAWLTSLALTESVDATFSPDEVWYQVWGDGQPLQRRDRRNGNTVPQPGDESMAIAPPQVAWEGHPVATAHLGVPTPVTSVLLTETEVVDFGAPWGLQSLAPLRDGRWIGTAVLDLANVWVVGTPGGEWGISSITCLRDEPGPILPRGDEVYTAAGRRIVVGD